MLAIDLPESLRHFEEHLGEIRPSLPGSGVPERIRVSNQSSGGLVARLKEQERSIEWLDSGGDEPLVVTGPSGAGKSSMLGALQEEAEAQGLNVVHAVAREFDLRPYSPFIRCLLYTSPSPRDRQKSRMPSSA